MHALVALMNALAGVVLGVWAGKRLGSIWMGPVMALVFGTMLNVYLQSAHLLSEPVYMAFCYVAILLLPEGREAVMDSRRMAALVLAVLAAYFARTAGLTLAAAAAAALVLHRTAVTINKKRISADALLVGVFIAAAAIWFIRNLVQGGHGMEYLSELARGDPTRAAGMVGLFTRVTHNLGMYLPYLGLAAFSPVRAVMKAGPALTVLSWALFAAVAAGVGIELRGRRFGAEAFTILSLLIVLSWPFEEDRFVLPIMPLAVFYLFRAVAAAARRAGGGRAARWALIGLAALTLAANAYIDQGYVRFRFRSQIEPAAPVVVAGYGQWTRPVINWAKYDMEFMGLSPALITQWLQYIILNRAAAELTPPGAIIMSRKPMLTYFYSGRESVPLLFDPILEKQWEYLKEKRVEFIVTGVAEDELRAVMERWPRRFQTVARIAPGPVSLIRVVNKDIP
ncbi:MAG TPA: hypothetical protein VM658_13255 [bacterium]|nr:hypothetical protein [bacterium]